MATVDPPFTPEQFRRQDEGDDARFYGAPRLVTHIDDAAIAAIGDLLPPDATILDLMSSWKSHLPPDVEPRRAVGLGLNAAELAANEQLDEYVVQNINTNPSLPFPDETFDIAIITVSIQYVVRPVTLFREIRRALKDGAPLVVIFSNRLFPTKAVRIWSEQDDQGRAGLVRGYFELAGGYRDITFLDRSPAPRGGARGRWFGLGGDPVYAVLGRKTADQ